MVGYNFQAIFERQIVERCKRQTIRPDRRRHARPGEPMQLFCEQRSRRCRKLLTPDPICTAVRPVEIVVSELLPSIIASISIVGIPLDRDEIEAFSRADGFAPERLHEVPPGIEYVRATARENMGVFWLSRHGDGRFEGVLLEWDPL